MIRLFDYFLYANRTNLAAVRLNIKKYRSNSSNIIVQEIIEVLLLNNGRLISTNLLRTKTDYGYSSYTSATMRYRCFRRIIMLTELRLRPVKF